MSLPLPLKKLMRALRVLPNVGEKTAARMAFHLLQRDRDGAEHLTLALADALQNLGHCARCNTFCEGDICELCADEARDPRRLCIVEMPSDLEAFEQAHCFDGYYFVLMGKVAPLDGLGVAALPWEALRARVLDGVEEVIIATNYTAEGEATAHCLAQLLRPLPVELSRISRGMPIGGEIEFTDLGTLAQAFYERKTF